MKKYYFFITALITIITNRLSADEFARALADLMLAEKDLLKIYREAKAEERPALEAQMLRAGIAPEVIKSEAIILKPVAPVPIAPPAPLSTKQADTGELTDAQLKQARQGLRKTTPNAPKTFAPLPGKPTEKELQEAIAERARKREQ